MRNWIYLVFGILFLFTQDKALADEFKVCGIFEMEGHIVIDKSKSYFIINNFSHSKIKVHIKLNEKFSAYDKLPVLVKIRIPNQCEFECTTNFVKILSVLDPFVKLKNPFFPRIRPQKIEKCL